MTQKRKIFFTFLLTALIAVFVIVLFPAGDAFLYKIRDHTQYKYESTINDKYVLPDNFIVEDTSSLPPAIDVPVLLYHGVIDVADGSNTLYKDFEDQMLSLKKNGWTTISIEDFYDFTQGKKEVPAKSFLLTFDDGRKDSYYRVDQILEALNFRATMYVITGRSLGSHNSQSSYHLSKNELSRMIKNGRWDMQAHTKNGHDLYRIDEAGNKGHFYSNKIWLVDEKRLETNDEYSSRIEKDLTEAKNELFDQLGVHSLSFAFPFGDFGENFTNFPEANSILLEKVKALYPVAFYQISKGKGATTNYVDENGFLFKRINVEPDWNGEMLIQKLDSVSGKKLPYNGNLSNMINWSKTWGNFEKSGEFLKLDSSSESKGSSIFLEGSYSWKDYTFSANVDWVKGDSLSLLGRYKDDVNYLSCNFTDEDVIIEQRVNNIDKVLTTKVGGTKNYQKNNIILKMKVYDKKTECYINNKLVARSTNLTSTELQQGGIGFETWDPIDGNTEVIIKSVSVDSI